MADLAQRRRVLIMGAAGRDFHNFLCCYREDPHTEVVAFTAAQIPSIAERRYPASLAGPSYPDGIPMYPETDLERLITTLHVDEVVFAYSDVANQTIMSWRNGYSQQGRPSRFWVHARRCCPARCR